MPELLNSCEQFAKRTSGRVKSQSFTNFEQFILTSQALSTLDELLDFLLDQGGSVGILDATNSTIERRQILFDHIKKREPKLGILFVESVCEDEKVSSRRRRSFLFSC